MCDPRALALGSGFRGKDGMERAGQRPAAIHGTLFFIYVFKSIDVAQFVTKFPAKNRGSSPNFPQFVTIFPAVRHHISRKHKKSKDFSVASSPNFPHFVTKFPAEDFV